MEKLSVWSLLFVSAVALFGSVVFASGSTALPKHLEQRELTDPARVAAWLKENAATVDKAFEDNTARQSKRVTGKHLEFIDSRTEVGVIERSGHRTRSIEYQVALRGRTVLARFTRDLELCAGDFRNGAARLRQQLCLSN